MTVTDNVFKLGIWHDDIIMNILVRKCVERIAFCRYVSYNEMIESTPPVGCVWNSASGLAYIHNFNQHSSIYFIHQMLLNEIEIDKIVKIYKWGMARLNNSKLSTFLLELHLYWNPGSQYVWTSAIKPDERRSYMIFNIHIVCMTRRLLSSLTASEVLGVSQWFFGG